MLTNERLEQIHKFYVVDSPRHGIPSRIVSELLDEVKRLKARFVAAEAICLSITGDYYDYVASTGDDELLELIRLWRRRREADGEC